MIENLLPWEALKSIAIDRSDLNGKGTDRKMDRV